MNWRHLELQQPRRGQRCVVAYRIMHRRPIVDTATYSGFHEFRNVRGIWIYPRIARGVRWIPYTEFASCMEQQ